MQMTPPEKSAPAPTPWLPSGRRINRVLGYIVVVLVIDTLAAQDFYFGIRWSIFRWQTWFGFDLYKFVFWLVIPFVVSIRRFDRDYFTTKRWRPIDRRLLILASIVGVVAVCVIPFVPALRETYPGAGDASLGIRLGILGKGVVWNISWLLGWEFMLRYWLLRHLQGGLPRGGWILVPVIEFIYHLQKAPLEAAGMLVFGLVLTAWAVRRRNVLLPFIAHALVEMALLLFLVVT